MNNLKYYNDSLAYDFDMFMPKEKSTAVPVQPKKQNIIKMPEKRTNRKAQLAVKKLSSAVFAIVASALMVTALCFNIALRIKVNEVNSQINRAKTQLNTLNSECVALQMEYERRVSYSNLEMEAAALGMKKLDKDQVVYIRVNDKNMAKNASGEIMIAEN